MKKKVYTGIDDFRWIAAILIITIHTSPLASFWETGDFVLTRVIARVGVPFFLMTSGFFLISEYGDDAESLVKFLKKTAVIYGLAILLYLPVNVYNGYFSQKPFLPLFIKDLVFDGTMYHLWYLPASMIGAVIAWFLVKRTNFYQALVISGILYAIGLFGDSYYGLIEFVPGISSFYGLLFQIFDYTRNGFFLAPVFFVMGGMIGAKKTRFTKKEVLQGFLVSAVLMLAEAMILHYFRLQRHDSMYLFLLPVMFFLFQMILGWRGKYVTWLRSSALVVYIIHPMMIVAVRLLAKLTGTQKLLVENSLLHFLAILAASVIFSVAAVVIWQKFSSEIFKKFRKSGISISSSENLEISDKTQRAWIEIDLKNLEHNVKELKKLMPQKCRMMAVIKAEAYGHGAPEVALALNGMGVFSFAAATIEEGIALRKKGVRGEILILGYTGPQRAKDLVHYDLTQTIVSYDHALEFSGSRNRIKAHIKIDTGMHRLGIDSSDFLSVKKLYSMKHLKICGMYTHLCCADSLKPQDAAFTDHQIGAFYQLVEQMKENKLPVPKLHIQSSYGLLNYPDLECDYVRIGIALYGVLSSEKQKTLRTPDLRPVLSLKARVILIRSVKKGETVGYGRDFTAERDSEIAILSIGYADGYPISLSNGRGFAVINGQQAPVAGRVCMDQLAVDITGLQGIQVGDIAELIGFEGKLEIASGVADRAGTISNELLSRMGMRLPRVVR